MKILIFAGGSGKRFWPISRVKVPKQFIKISNNTSTLEMAIKRVQPAFGLHNIFISTNEDYIGVVKEIFPKISSANIFGEPEMKDVGPAAGLALIRLRKMGVREPIAILWADHFMENVRQFQDKLKLGEELVLKKKAEIVFYGEKPAFANPNVGWIDIGKKFGKEIHHFEDWMYRPVKEICEKKLKAGKSLINTGYFVSTLDYLLSIYKQYNPDLYRKLKKIEEALDTPNESSVIDKIYPTIEPIHFDHCVPYHVKKKDVLVLETKMGWEDPGTLYALKNYLSPGKKNAVKGNVFDYDNKDCMLYNYDSKKLLAGVKLDGMVVVNTKDAILVVHKDYVRDVSEMLKSKKFKDSKFAKYL